METILRDEYYQYNTHSNFLEKCYTYDWLIEGFDETTDIFRMCFICSEGQPTIKKAILIGKNGRQLRFRRIVNESGNIVYEGCLPKENRTGARVRYWRPARNSHADHDVAESMLVVESWIYPDQ